MDLLKALLGNGWVNTFQHTHAVNNTVEVFFLCGPRHATVEELFSVWSATCNSRRAVFCVVWATQQKKSCFLCGLRHATEEELFSVWSEPRNRRRAVFCVAGARNNRRAVFSAWSLPRLYNGSLFIALSSAVQSSWEYKDVNGACP
jgi:hypothetical protein